jgi:hypothetical protein
MKKSHLVLIVLTSILLSTAASRAQKPISEQHIEVALRMIGHEILLSSGDSTSRILPIVKENDRYRIQFESPFEFSPEELVTTVKRVVQETNMANSYIVEVEKCESREVVYSFKMDDLKKSDIIPCRARAQPKACYSLIFTLFESRYANTALLTDANDPSRESNTEIGSATYVVTLALSVLLVVVFFLLWKRKNRYRLDPNLISIGAYLFDKRNAELLIKDQKIELTSKEADLLLLLYTDANTTVEREVILNMVWGDEGGYVGRTLDVFISKLRKKLEFDSNVKIVNIRGIGYKLVMDV